MCEQRDTSVPRKHHAGYRERGNWGTTKTINIHRVVYSFNLSATSAQQTRSVVPMMSWCWASVVDDGPTPAHHWANASCLLGLIQCCFKVGIKPFISGTVIIRQYLTSVAVRF